MTTVTNQVTEVINDFAIAINRSILNANHESFDDGIRDTLRKYKLRLQRIRRLQLKDAMPKVGIFGPPKRGKSSFINALMGENLMPTSPIPMSSTSIEVMHENRPAGGWKVTIEHDNYENEVKEAADDQEVRRLIERYASHRGSSSSRKITVEGQFDRSLVLNEGAILIDTPGAEVAFETTDDITEDTRRALEMLEQCDLVVFCVRADQLEAKSDKVFYEKHLRLLLPVNIVTFRDKWQASDDALMEAATKNYGFLRADTRLVDNKSFKNSAIEAGTNTNPLESFLIEEIKKLHVSHGLGPLIREYLLFLSRHEALCPERVYLQNLQHSVNAAASTISGSDELIDLTEKLVLK